MKHPGTNGLKEKLAHLPEKPGVYVFRDSDDRAIYVGKAKSLRDRLRSYLKAPPSWDYKGGCLREEIADVEVTVCASEVDALVLESTLIKKYRPRFNVLLRDDKSYPYIAVTSGEEFPRVLLVRGKKNPGTVYYGPYINARAAKETIRLLQKVFPLRHCHGSKPGGKGSKPCLYYEMKMCTGPCTGDVDSSFYRRQVDSLCSFLEGRHNDVLGEFQENMLDAAEKRDYESAARIRNQIRSAEKVLAHKGGRSQSSEEYDVIGIHADELGACLVVARVRGGMYLGNLVFFADIADSRSDEEIVTEFVKQYYFRSGYAPRQILVPAEPAEVEGISEWLSLKSGKRAEIKVPRRGRKSDELKLACSNAALALQGARIKGMGDRKRAKKALEDLAGQLELERYPLRVECYDVSTMAGTASVGSMVVFEDGNPRRRDYRKFSMKFTSGVDDVGMLKEMLYRRFKRYLKHREDAKRDADAGGFGRKPDLVLVDGGKAQIGAAMEVLKVLGIEGIEVASLAKRLEEIFRPGRREPIRISRGADALLLIQRIRDEAHRTAVAYNRSIMVKGTSSSWLDGVSGVGPARKKALIRHFGTPRNIRQASLCEISSVAGIPAGIAKCIYEASRKLEGEDIAG